MKLLPVLVTITVILLLLHRAAPSSASLLPSFFHTRRGSSDSGVATTGSTSGGGGPLYDHFPSREILDPFFALEHLPFGLDLALPYPPSAARIDWKETPEAHVVKVDAPGLGPGDLTVEVEEDSRVLRISGERKREEHKEGERWHIVERVVEERFSRQIRLPADADLDSVSARLKDGVLTVIVGKQDPGNVKQGPRVVAIDIDGLAANEQDNVRKIEGQSQEHKAEL